MTASPAPAAPRPSFWQRRLIAPLRAQLTQGVTPDRLALTLAVGTACSLLPFLGFTALLNLGVGLALRLNQPILQVLNQLLGPLQLVLILAYVRAGEWIWRAEPVPLSIPTLVAAFRADPWAFLERFGLTGVHAATAWFVSVPLIVAVLYYPLRPVLRRLARRA
ncbi:MAG: DUF2062 domain-containing protein [Verrucomicrobia bacterium]|nr:DUF2062 domain-containing protein [Verrucomicrobiota bacterium]